MSESKHTKIHIKNLSPASKADDFVAIVDIETDGHALYMEASFSRAKHLVKCWNSHDALLEACKIVMKVKPQERMNDNTLAYVEQAIELAEKE